MLSHLQSQYRGNRTQLLVSVRSPAEATVALEAGVDILDVKEPWRGSLGRPSMEVVREVVTLAAGRVPVSVALGEWFQPVEDLPWGVTWAKLGLGWKQPGTLARWHAVRRQLEPVPLIGVAYADWQRVCGVPFERVLKWTSGSGVLIDTAIKDGRGLLHWCKVTQLQRYRAMCHRAGLFLALAGSLSLADVKLLAREVKPDIIAVRGAACVSSSRLALVDPARIRWVQEALQAGCRSSSS
ncbi:MAG: (5-formylfuran-3-yl)methyl phosphate synthase [Gemmatales bacterium]